MGDAGVDGQPGVLMILSKQPGTDTVELTRAVNEELQHRNEELEQANNDLTNLIGSVNIPILILGIDLRIRRFTPMAARMFDTPRVIAVRRAVGMAGS